MLALKTPLIRECIEVAAKVADGWADSQHAASFLMEQTREVTDPLPPDQRKAFLADLAAQIEEAGRAADDHEVFTLFAEGLRTEADGVPQPHPGRPEPR